MKQSKLKQLIKETIKKVLMEDADPSKIDPKRFPTKLSQVNPDNASKYVSKGDDSVDKGSNDDVIKTSSTSFPVSALKPSQSSMNIEKALGLATAMINKKMPTGGDLGALISSDNHIMDGHHRWVATAMVDPTAKVGGTLVNLPGAQLIGVLNAITAGKFGITKGKAATGGFDQFKEGPIKSTLEKFSKEGIPGKYPQPPEEIANAIKVFTNGGTLEDAVAKFVKNLSSVTFAIPPGAPSRPDMPVIDADKGHDDVAADMLAKGQVDVNPPYAKESVIKLKDILNEITETRVKVKDLTFNMLRSIFTSKYQDLRDSDVRPTYKDPIYLPKGDGSSNGIIDDIALDNYKEYIMDRVGDVEIILDPTTNKGRIEDPAFKDREERLGRGIQSYYDSKKPGEFTGD